MNDELKSQTLYLREVTDDDVDLLFRWVNAPDTRSNSFNSHTISRKEHEDWFTRVMADTKQILYIMMRRN